MFVCVFVCVCLCEMGAAFIFHEKVMKIYTDDDDRKLARRETIALCALVAPGVGPRICICAAFKISFCVAVTVVLMLLLLLQMKR